MNPKMKVLVVDDEKIVLESCRRILDEMDLEITLASSAKAALEELDRNPFCLILMDIKMPEIDGITLMQQVKGKWPNIPIIVMSGYATNETLQEVSQSQAAAFLPKPFTPDELIGAVCHVLNSEENVDQ
jgi:DNA-binding NtrC family response regulator